MNQPGLKGVNYGFIVEPRRLLYKLKMEKQTKYNFSPTHLALLEQFENLFSRQNLCTNNYLYHQIKQDFQIPIQTIAEQRRVSQISKNQNEIREALKACSLVKIIDPKTIRLIEFPTLKFQASDKQQVYELIRQVKALNRKVSYFQKRDERQIHMSLLQDKKVAELETLVSSINKDLRYKTADLQSDLKAGINAVRKIKQKSKKNHRNQKFSLERPPAIFIRKAVESSSDEEEDNSSKSKKQLQRDKKYREKPIINEDEFPTLN